MAQHRRQTAETKQESEPGLSLRQTIVRQGETIVFEGLKITLVNVGTSKEGDAPPVKTAEIRVEKE